MKKTLYLAFAIFTSILPILAQKANVKGADRIADKKGDYKEARRLIGEALQHEDTKDDPKTWYVAGYVEESNFEQEVEKIQRQKGTPDLPVMNKALLDMFDYYKTVLKMEEGSRRLGKYSKKVKKCLEPNLLNFFNAGIFYMNNKDFKNAVKAFDDFKEIKSLPFFADEDIAKVDSTSMQADFFACYASYYAKDKEGAIKRAEKIKNVPFRQNDIYQLLAQTYEELNKRDEYINILKEGMQLFPSSNYFSVNLINTLIQDNKRDEAISILAKAIEVDPKNYQLYDVMGKLYEEIDQNKSIEFFQKALDIKPDFSESLFNIGRIYYNQAVTLKSSDKITKKTEDQAEALFRKALPYLEKAYEINPDSCYYILSTVYYNLKMSDKYDAIKEKYNL